MNKEKKMFNVKIFVCWNCGNTKTVKLPTTFLPDLRCSCSRDGAVILMTEVEIKPKKLDAR